MQLLNWLTKSQEIKSLKDEVRKLTAINIAYQTPIIIGQIITPYDSTNYITDGYNKNAAVYSIVTKCAKKLGQVPVNHYRIKKGERKTWEEYLVLTKDLLTPYNVNEAKRMRKKALEDAVVDSELSRLLQNPNGHQSGAVFREQLYGYKLLTGEGNIWLNRAGIENGKPRAMEILPKYYISLQTKGSLWEIANYYFNVYGQQIIIPKQDLIMWAFPNYNFNPTTLEHLRGFAPLNAGLMVLQSDNEAEARNASMNRNQGAAGLLYRKDMSEPPTAGQTMEIRRQVNATVNTSDMAGAIATLAGEWGYLQFGLDSGQLKLLEQSDVNMNKLCNIYDVPPGLFKADQTYENMKEANRNWIFQNIAPAAYSLRDELNAKLLPAFNLDRETNVLDMDILALPEMSIDILNVIKAMKDADFLSMNEKRLQAGFEKMDNPAMDSVYVQSNIQTIEQAFEGPGGDLSGEVAMLGGQ